jgi:hypothetical protein
MAASWKTLPALQRTTGPFELHHCLLYDNSPASLIDVDALPAGMSLIEAPGNRGTAGAYAEATAMAEAKGCEWLLLLDQDTELPADYLRRAAEAAEAAPDAAILVPRVHHGRHLVSPARITAWGSIRPASNPLSVPGVPTAISSGILVRTAAIASILPFPKEIWLDYVDHWMFLSFAGRDRTIGLIDVDLSHDLSIRTPSRLSSDRLRNILEAESVLYCRLDARARAWLPVRRLMRAIRYLASGHFRLAGTTLRHLYPLAHFS